LLPFLHRDSMQDFTTQQIHGVNLESRQANRAPVMKLTRERIMPLMLEYVYLRAIHPLIVTVDVTHHPAMSTMDFSCHHDVHSLTPSKSQSNYHQHHRHLLDSLLFRTPTNLSLTP